MISTLKVNVAWACRVVVGEFQAAKAGLGYLITYGARSSNEPRHDRNRGARSHLHGSFAAIQALEVLDQASSRTGMTRDDLWYEPQVHFADW